MGALNVSNKKSKDSKSQSQLDSENLRSKYILKILFDNLTTEKTLRIIKYNKNLQSRLDISLQHYKEYFQTEIEIIPIKYKYGKFINVSDDESHYHIYFNNSKEEIKKYKLTPKDDNVTKIKINIDYEVKSYKNLFIDCQCLGLVSFKKFKIDNINDMSYMFYGCSFLLGLDLSNFITDSVTDFSYMFFGCFSLKKLDLSKFNTGNAITMCNMFDDCSSLEKLNLSNFNFNKVNDMRNIFSRCSLLKDLNISNLNTNNVTNLSSMFSGCKSLEVINLTSLDTSNVINTL